MDYNQIVNAAAALWDEGYRPGDAGRIAHAYGFDMDTALDICAAMEDFNND